MTEVKNRVTLIATVLAATKNLVTLPNQATVIPEGVTLTAWDEKGKARASVRSQHRWFGHGKGAKIEAKFQARFTKGEWFDLDGNAWTAATFLLGASGTTEPRVEKDEDAHE